MFKSKKAIVLTGGGTAGHVMAHLAMESGYRSCNWQLVYIGSAGVEKRLMEDRVDKFYVIPTGKYRRYFSLQNFIDVFKVLAGCGVAFFILLFKRPFVVFSKGGFVSVPVCVASKCLGIPIVTHESDYSPGLATKIAAKLGAKVLYTFPQTANFLNGAHTQFVGSPVRESLNEGDKSRGMTLCGFDPLDPRPILLISGGSQGSSLINRIVESCLEEILSTWRVIHLTGPGNKVDFKGPGYFQAEFVREGFEDIVACADGVVGRAGSNSIFEFLTLRKPMLLIPLVQGSRGDQLDNARAFSQKGWALVLDEASLSPEALVSSLERLSAEKETLKEHQSKYDGRGVVQQILAELVAVQ